MPQAHGCSIPTRNSLAAWHGADLVASALEGELCDNTRLQMGNPDAFACCGFPGKIFPVHLKKTKPKQKTEKIFVS